MQFQMPKRFVNFLLAVLTAAILLGIFFAARSIIRRAALERAASYLSKNYFKDAEYSVDHEKREVFFTENKIDFLQKFKLNGKVVFSFPVKFFEFPWQARCGRITVDGVCWELDLQNKKINGFERDEFLRMFRTELETFKEKKDGKCPAFLTSGKLILTNPEGKKRELAMKSILQEFNDKTYLLGIHAGDMKVNFLYNDSVKKVVGQYQAKQSDFEFIRLSFGIPGLFAISGVERLSGEFRYDTAERKLDFIRGSSDFGVQASIKGSIFTLYGNSLGKINWEYLNPQNWQIELRNASSITPVRAGLHYFVLSQNTLEKDALSFDGEIEFNPNSFRDMFGLELDKRTSKIRHRIVGKWDMVRKNWELSRLDTQKRVPQVKLKWNDFDIAFRWQNFKLSGRGDQSDHFGFHYELDMSDFDWKDKKGNTVIATQTKLEGDCILSLADDSLKPLSNGKISCAVADGAFGDSRFLLTNAFLNFSPDKDGKNKYHLSCRELKVGIPDLQKGVIFSSPLFEGSVSADNILFSAPEIKVNYKNIFELSGSKWFVRKNSNDKLLHFELPVLSGLLKGKNVSVNKMSGELVESGDFIYVNGRSGDIKYADDSLAASGAELTIEGNLPHKGNFICKRITVAPSAMKIKNPWFQANFPKSSFKMTFNDKHIWHNWVFESEKSQIKYKNKEFVISDITAGEYNNGNYLDGLLKSTERPYNFDITYTRKNSDITLKNGRINFEDNVIWGLTGDIKLSDKNDFFAAKMQYAEFKPAGMSWENGNLNLNGTRNNGFAVVGFNGMTAIDMANIKFTGRNAQGLYEFDVKNFPARYIEKILGVQQYSFSGTFEGKVTTKDGAVFNPFNIQTFYLKNNLVMRVRLGELEKFAGKGDSIDDEFAADALKDFFAKTLTLDYHKVGDYAILNVNTLGKTTNLLPYEYDVKAKKLKKSDVALFNSEVEVSMKYMMKKP